MENPYSSPPSFRQWVRAWWKYWYGFVGSTGVGLVMTLLTLTGYPIPVWSTCIVWIIALPVAHYHAWWSERLHLNRIDAMRRNIGGCWISEINSYKDHIIFKCVYSEKDGTFKGSANATGHTHEANGQYDAITQQFKTQTERTNRDDPKRQTTMLGNCIVWDEDTLITWCDRTDGANPTEVPADYKEIRLFKRQK
jgi:hypothetical protein